MFGLFSGPFGQTQMSGIGADSPRHVTRLPRCGENMTAQGIFFPLASHGGLDYRRSMGTGTVNFSGNDLALR
jgi:hypothetical protein